MKNEEKIFSVDSPEDSSGFLLWQVTSLWQRGIKKALEPLGLTHSQFVLLASAFWFHEQKEAVTQIKLSNHSKIDPMTTSTVLRTLQTKGYLKRQEHSSDTRAKTVALTEPGLEIVKKAVKLIEVFDNDFFAALKGEEKGFNGQLIKLLQAGDAHHFDIANLEG